MKRKILALIVTIFGTGILQMQITYAYLSSMQIIESNTVTTENAFPVTPPVTSFQTVVINEIMWMGNNTHNSTVDEWIELRNTTNQSIDLSNWIIERLGDVTNPYIVIPVGKSIPANGYFLIANYDLTHISSILNILPDVVNSNISLDNNGELLILRDSALSHIDVANGNNAWLKGSNGTPKKSMQRILVPGDGTNGNNWIDATTSTNLDSGTTELATPKAAN